MKIISKRMLRYYKKQSRVYRRDGKTYVDGNRVIIVERRARDPWFYAHRYDWN